jgi:hypothetical protein
MDTNQPDVLTDIISENQKRRKSLLPGWIKVFMWIFLVIGAIVPLAFLAGLFGGHFETSIYGLESTDPLSTTTISVLIIFLLKGITAFGLLKEKSWAIKLAITDAILGILICSFIMVYATEAGDKVHSFRLELVALVPYLIKMLKIRTEWENIPDMEHA